MIYLDTSVALAHILGEDPGPAVSIWQHPLVASRLMEYEIWTRIHSRGLARTHSEAVRLLLSRVAILELAPPVLARALEPFPGTVRTLDALHLASIEFLRSQKQPVELATYDQRLLGAARALGIPIAKF